MLQRLAIAILLCLLSLYGHADVTKVGNATTRLNLDGHLQFLVDTKSEWTLADIQSAKRQAQFQQPTGKQAAFGYTKASYWFKITLHNTGTRNSWMVNIDLPALDQIDFYVPETNQPNRYRLLRAGDTLAYAARPLPTREFTFPLTLPTNTPVTLYWRVQTQSSMTVPTTLWDPESYARKSETTHLVFGLYFGFIFALAAYNLVLYLSRIHISYLYYVISVFGIGMWQLTHSGLAYRYLWPNAIYFQNVAVNLFAAMGIAGLALFTLYFLKLKVTAERLNTALWIIVTACLLTMIGAVTNLADQVLLSRINTLLALISGILCVTAGILCWQRGQLIARFLVFSQCVWLSALLITALRAAGLASTEFLSLYGTHLSIPIEMLLLAIALSDRYRQMHRQREAARELALHTLRTTERMLEQRVEERTEALLQTNKKLEDANHELDRLNHEKTELLRIAAHDLKNPVSQLRAASDLLKHKISQWPAEKSSAMLGNMHQATVRMMDIITKLLDLDAIESGKLQVNATRMDWCGSIHCVLDELNDWAASKQISLQSQMPDHIDIWADAELVYQICENLISNAIKFSPAGSMVTIRLIESSGLARLEVEDQGPGIQPDEMPQLFRSFAKLSARPTGGEHSTGLGLSIVKRLTTSMAGRVWYERPGNKGARFCVTLPLASRSVAEASG
ncbi:sensor histidine kinase [Chitinivorax sp. B]|uniref:sensor histidine kinase n=1 Tax=Chitinivorax sp. B TaxID=2502235 RepID=UPI0010F8D54F|nr:sensor histidine kinase [Chitinivorax sp. B]